MFTGFNIDFKKQSIRLLPPDKRYPRIISWIQVLLSSVQWVRDLWLGDYNTGSTASAFAVQTYAKYARVIYNKVVYESLVSGNNDTPPSANWMVVQKNFIGLSERIYYNGQTLVLTYALNKWFGTTFRQPPSQSDIYIANIVPVPRRFRIANYSINSSNISNVTSSEYIDNATYSAASLYNFSIYCPVAVYNALSANAANRDKIFRDFVSNYIPAGLLYNILTY